MGARGAAANGTFPLTLDWCCVTAADAQYSWEEVATSEDKAEHGERAPSRLRQARSNELEQSHMVDDFKQLATTTDFSLGGFARQTPTSDALIFLCSMIRSIFYRRVAEVRWPSTSQTYLTVCQTFNSMPINFFSRYPRLRIKMCEIIQDLVDRRICCRLRELMIMVRQKKNGPCQQCAH